MSKSLYVYDDKMGSFTKIGDYDDADCYHRALPGEPRFTLLGRDPDFQRLVKEWAVRRARDIECGDRPITDSSLVANANETAKNGAIWRRTNMGKWRKS